MSAAKTILITGATGKVGRRLVKHFLEQGLTVVATSRSAEKLAALAAESAGLRGSLATVEADLPADVPGPLLECLNRRDLLPHALVNNARDLTNLKVGADGLPGREQWSAELVLGVAVPLELTMALAAAPGSRLGAVVNIASMYGVVAANPALYDHPAQQSPIHYGTIKAALLHLTKEMAVRLAPRGIRVNAVSFGGVEGRVSEEFKARYAKLCPLGRMLREDELASAVEFLVSAGASGMTGHNLVVDGGWSTW
jgi:NAD(P)-dependent dehydrogenase (short-subunit alcohol dehydrogenase family)